MSLRLIVAALGGDIHSGGEAPMCRPRATAAPTGPSPFSSTATGS